MVPAKGFLLTLLVVLVASSSFSSHHQVKGEKYEDEDDYYDSRERVLENSYHGLIKENETFVEITPLIKVDETKICGFHIIKKNKEIPFQIELVNELGILKAKKTLNCEKRKNYKFDITAVFCDGSHSKSASVHISVIDINEYSPTFLQPSYVTEVDEGRLYQEIIRVEATDKDCTPLFGDVCKYEILTNDQPFTIDNEGSIRNTEPLSHKISHNHILSVVAYDCAMKQSAPVMVNIRVRRVCEAHVMGVAERIDYVANSMESVSLFPKIHLELCDMQCKGEDMVIQSSVSLKTKHISFGCDRDASQCLRRLSESGSGRERDGDGLVDLLQKNTDWTKDLTYDEGAEAIFHFDGSSGAIVPKNVVQPQDFAAHQFSIVTMFRHNSIVSTDKHTKEHIVCSADDHKMNRHHMALFVRNCRLILLLRKDFNDGDLNIFSPAEWRWKIPQVCDNEWHHYTINVDLPKVDLYIDGIRFESNVEDRHSNPEVIDDWPLHAAHGINTTLAIGACYQGSENRLKHGFSGDIAEIKLSTRKVLTASQIRCGTDCAEKLLPPADHYLEPEQQIQSNTQMNKIIIEGSNKTNIEQLLQQIQYINSKESPTIGRRNIQVMTTVSCPNKKAIRLPTIDTYIMVSSAGSSLSGGSMLASATSSSSSSGLYNKILVDKPLATDQKPQIVISGNSNHLVSYPDIKEGVKILAQINISVYTGKDIRPELQKLDSCNVNVFPSLNPDHEEITIDDKDGADESLFKFDIKTQISKEGVEMIGYDTIENYQHVLKSLVYINKKPAYYLNRVFKLTCSQVDDHFRSAEYTLTLTVLHPKQQPTSSIASASAPSSNVLLAISTAPSEQHPAVAVDSHDNANQYAHVMLHSHDVQESQSKVRSSGGAALLGHEKLASSHSTMLIVVICGSFVLLICGVGIARLRNSNAALAGGSSGHGAAGGAAGGSAFARNLTDKHLPCPKVAPDQQLDWDDSALTITINPMQHDALSDESSESDNSDSEDEEVLNGRYKNVSQLEWDNSTI
ncbi:calsyntenin-1 isoform X1 [Anopheles arabiensis]|uniref:Cadherin domain-containing protein n=1 Tax=Anopheles arabiensis TaxID=7173 RepID=A0A2C9GPX3_ANOAR|nr:calsyntenin-1 isoform X1 [Anopheles gambiae]XP_001688050.2 calsyntenin-1 isoform X1 [Anopheles gambiae]XP_040166183.1 calsyntenin-1 isoform X1 [Anopheles arabiensis]XP_040166259.1 calsyntenin-1 isoform X1 [Anopheles arabiensis]XP_040166339.1 calsyntenin-1 isoform X1 [Anopheles arabiensis]XP_040166424.1 calsyntenin-1 isoform X1 [Anopheles arabiensis]XP_040166503.1 calsyntenin-1 isoform X1 [Anopheles arabiensis]XP_040166584.1 calsyntenin-1 isoform X1 [Anopheles arabiensis]XP_061502586.1 ca